MEFDHVRGRKLFNLSQLIRLDPNPDVPDGRNSAKLARWKLILAEVDKCDIVCANCHRIRHMNRSPSIKKELQP